MLIIGGSASQPLAEKVAKELGQEPGRLEVKRFPDGEKYLRIHDNVKDQDVVAIQSLYRTPDENIFELLLLTDTLRDLGARSITTVVPYLAYARQDSRFFPGEAVSSASVARLLESAGATSFLTIDCHLHRLGDVAKICKKGGANRIFVVCTHPVLAEGALKRIKAAGVLKVIGTDTYPGPITKVTVAPVIAAALKS